MEEMPLEAESEGGDAPVCLPVLGQCLLLSPTQQEPVTWCLLGSAGKSEQWLGRELPGQVAFEVPCHPDMQRELEVQCVLEGLPIGKPGQ